MKHILYIQASPRGSRSNSMAAADAFVDALRELSPEIRVTTLNLFDATLPAFDRTAAEGKYAIMCGTPATPEATAAFGMAVRLIDQFKAADGYLFAIPMWNFGIPYVLKQDVDLIVQPTYTFAVGEDGYRGLVTGKTAVTVYARGGDYSDPAAAAVDFQKRYMDHILGFIGITDVRTVIVQPTLAAGPDAAQAKLAAATDELRALARTINAR